MLVLLQTQRVTYTNFMKQQQNKISTLTAKDKTYNELKKVAFKEKHLQREMLILWKPEREAQILL